MVAAAVSASSLHPPGCIVRLFPAPAGVTIDFEIARDRAPTVSNLGARTLLTPRHKHTGARRLRRRTVCFDSLAN